MDPMHRTTARHKAWLAITLVVIAWTSHAGARVLEKDVMIDADIDAVWRAWTTEEGLEHLSPESNIELRIGGAYEWFLDGEPDAAGRRGSEGSYVLAFVPGRMIAFSWTFPPDIPELRLAGERTQVAVIMDDVGAHGVRVRLVAGGWRSGEAWDRGWDYFDAAWGQVLSTMKAHLESDLNATDIANRETALLANAADVVRCTEIAFSHAVESGDAEMFASFLDDDARFVAANVLRGPDAIVAAWAGFMQPTGPGIKWRPDIVEVAVSGDLALSRGPYRVRGLDERGQATEQWGIYNSVWRKRAHGDWRILFDAGNPGRQQLSAEQVALLDAPVKDCDLSAIKAYRLQPTGEQGGVPATRSE